MDKELQQILNKAVDEVRIGNLVMKFTEKVPNGVLMSCFRKVDCNSNHQDIRNIFYIWTVFNCREATTNEALQSCGVSCRVQSVNPVTDQDKVADVPVYVRYLQFLGHVYTFESSVPMEAVDLAMHMVRQRNKQYPEANRAYLENPEERGYIMAKFIGVPVLKCQSIPDFLNSDIAKEITPEVSKFSTHVRYMRIGNFVAIAKMPIPYHEIDGVSNIVQQSLDNEPDRFANLGVEQWYTENIFPQMLQKCVDISTQDVQFTTANEFFTKSGLECIHDQIFVFASSAYEQQHTYQARL